MIDNMNDKLPISEWKTGVDEQGGYWIDPITDQKWRWKSGTPVETSIAYINVNSKQQDND
jgi:hypothetical protein